MTSLMYGAGLRLLENVELRVKAVDFERGEVTVRNGKGGQDRVTMLPAALRQPLREHLARVTTQHQADLVNGRGCVAFPGTLRTKYAGAEREWGWQWLFPAPRFYVDPGCQPTLPGTSADNDETGGLIEPHEPRRYTASAVGAFGYRVQPTSC